MHRFSAAATIPTKIIIGKDTRLSGDMIEDALAAGICSAGGEACLAGILPTPAVAYLTASTDASAGIVISASHNPFFDNGIKIFDADGFKLADSKEDEIENLLLGENTANSADEIIRDTGSIESLKDASERYLAFYKTPCLIQPASMV